jgi:hypothetical protein
MRYPERSVRSVRSVLRLLPGKQVLLPHTTPPPREKKRRRRGKGEEEEEEEEEEEKRKKRNSFNTGRIASCLLLLRLLSLYVASWLLLLPRSLPITAHTRSKITLLYVTSGSTGIITSTGYHRPAFIIFLPHSPHILTFLAGVLPFQTTGSPARAPAHAS